MYVGKSQPIVKRAPTKKVLRELDAYVEAWQKLKAQGLDVGLWENMNLVSDFMAAMGRKGGRVRNPRKGFGSMTRAQRVAAARKGLAKRWGKKSNQERAV